MKIINAGYEIIKEPCITKKIERIARICYKSEDKIGPGTDRKMLENLIKRQHLAMLEHGDVCMEVSGVFYDLLDDIIHTIENNLAEVNGTLYVPKKIYLRRTATVLKDDKIRYVVSGNIRAWYEFFVRASEIGALAIGMYIIVNEQIGGLFDVTHLGNTDIGIDYDTWKADPDKVYFRLIEDVSTLTEMERMVHETMTVLFTVDRGVTHELVRMRDSSFAQESTRYCNYNLDKFDKEITVIKPCFWSEDDDKYNMWKHSMEYAEVCYNNLVDAGATAQEARGALPHSVKANLVITTNLIEWEHIFSLRACDSTGPAHPQVKEVMIPLLQEVRDGNYNFAFRDLVAATERV